jgi:hypothetical protein
MDRQSLGCGVIGITLLFALSYSGWKPMSEQYCSLVALLIQLRKLLPALEEIQRLLDCS